MAKQKYYVVWKGRRTGIFKSWETCSAQVTGFTDAKFKSFESLAAAESAFRAGYAEVKAKPAPIVQRQMALTRPELPSISVDAACSGVPGPVEWRGVETETGKELFRFGPFPDGTNNIGEFLAIVEGQAWLASKQLNWPIYSDSVNAMLWIKAKKCRTKMERTLRNAPLFELIARAEETIKTSANFRVLKWDTKMWGENPADFGRK
jgi:ribonuclease HI